jgi:hypothetical protein
MILVFVVTTEIHYIQYSRLSAAAVSASLGCLVQNDMSLSRNLQRLDEAGDVFSSADVFWKI